jgi:hypothetical protein
LHCAAATYPLVLPPLARNAHREEHQERGFGTSSPTTMVEMRSRVLGFTLAKGSTSRTTHAVAVVGVEPSARSSSANTEGRHGSTSLSRIRVICCVRTYERNRAPWSRSNGNSRFIMPHRARRPACSTVKATFLSHLVDYRLVLCIVKCN